MTKYNVIRQRNKNTFAPWAGSLALLCTNNIYHCLAYWSNVMEMNRDEKKIVLVVFFHSSGFITSSIKIWWHFWCVSVEINFFLCHCVALCFQMNQNEWFQEEQMRWFLCEFRTHNYFNGNLVCFHVIQIEWQKCRNWF